MGISRGVNKVILIGNLGKDPEVKHLESGTVLAKFSLATTEAYKNKNNEKVTNTEWHNIVFFGPQAEIIEKYVKKGDPLYIEGKIRSRSYDDKEGNKRYITEIFGDSMEMLGRKRDNNSSPSPQESAANTVPSDSQEGDDLPF